MGGVGMAVAWAAAWSGARSFSERMRWNGGGGGLGGGMVRIGGGMATRPWRRALAEASRSGWRGNRAGGMRRWTGRWHGPEREASASACGGMAVGLSGGMGGGMVRSAKLQRAPAVEWRAAAWRRGLRRSTIELKTILTSVHIPVAHESNDSPLEIEVASLGGGEGGVFHHLSLCRQFA
jgi:hypothetical protein